MSVVEAAQAWQAKRLERSSGSEPGKTEKVRSSRPYTVAALVANYLSGQIDVSRSDAGALAARRRLESAIEPIASRAAASITRSDAFELLEAYRSVPTAAAKLRSLLGGAWDYALDAGRIDGDTPNWWRVIMRGRLKSKGKIIGGEHQGQTRRVLQAEEVKSLLAWLPNMHALGRDCIVMYLWTATRGVEFLSIRSEHVRKEADGWWWTCPKSATKNARHAAAVDLRVPLVGRALEVVQRRLKAVGRSGYLFEDLRGEPYTQHDFSTYIYSLQPYSAKAAMREGEGLVLPVTQWTPHNLRRTARTLLASLGCPNEVGEAILGHLPAEIVGTYNAYTYDAERRHWLMLLSQRLVSL
jgi:integrase